MTTHLLTPPALHPRLRLHWRVLAAVLALLGLAGSALGAFAFFASGGPSAILLFPTLGIGLLALLLATAAVRGHDPISTYRPEGPYATVVWAAALGDTAATSQANEMHALTANAIAGVIPVPGDFRLDLLERVEELSAAIRAIDTSLPTQGFDHQARATARTVLHTFLTRALADLAASDKRG